MITYVKKNVNSDTRSSIGDVSYSGFVLANNLHINDVSNTMNRLAFMLMSKGCKHDYTKVTKSREYYKDYKHTINNGDNFTDSSWYKYHVTTEKHHLNDFHSDINLLDILEHIVDCTCAGKSRSGEVYPILISDDKIRLALDNTIKLIYDMVDVVE